MINSVYEPIIFTGNGSATTFAFNWKVAEEDFLVATLVDIATKAETVLVLDTDYSITGVGEDAGGSVSYPLTGDPMPSTKKLVLSLDIPPLQEIAFEDQGGFFPLTHERAFDKVTQILQGFKEILARCVKVSIVSGDDPDELIAQLNADVAAAAAAAAAAGAAQTAAETAQGLAETAKTGAETAQGLAETAQGLAETAKTGAETAQGLAEDARDAAQSAQAAAVAAQGAAEDAQEAAETAQGVATTQAGIATTQAGLAATAKTDAETAQTAAEAAQAAAEAAAGTFTKASQAEAEAGTEDTHYMTALKVKQAINKQRPKAMTSLTVSGGAVATDAALGPCFKVTVDGNFTLSNPTNGEDGKRISWRIKQDATGSRILTLGNKFRTSSDIGTLVLSTAASSIDYIAAEYDSVDDKWDIVAFAPKVA